MADDLTSLQRPPSDPQPENEPPEPSGRPRRWSPRQVGIALGAGVLAAAIVVVLVLTLGGSSNQNANSFASAPATQTQSTPTPAQNTTPQQSAAPAPVVSGPSADWLGMQIITSPAGVVVNTVKLGSLAGAAGFEPGDQIEQIDGHQIDSVDQIRTLTAKIPLGQPMKIEVLRSSVMVMMSSLPMKQRPTFHQ